MNLDVQPTEVPHHPTLIIVHLIFKAGSAALYLILKWIVNGIFSSGKCDGFCSAMTFTVVFMLAIDFWITKNVSGRFLVGLRWWNEIREDGKDKWIFESNEGRKKYYTSESMIFWGSLIAATLFWGIFAIVSLLSLSPTNFFITCTGTVLNVINVTGFIKCARKEREEVQAQVQGYVVQQAVSGAINQGGAKEESSEDE